jgi:hypothetical protein
MLLLSFIMSHILQFLIIPNISNRDGSNSGELIRQSDLGTGIMLGVVSNPIVGFHPMPAGFRSLIPISI